LPQKSPLPKSKPNLASYHHYIDKHLNAHSKQWSKLLAKGSSDDYYALFSRCIEKAALEYADVKQGRRKYEGRGKINIKQVKEPEPASYHPDFDKLAIPLTKEGLRMLQQQRRLVALRNCMLRLKKLANAVDCHQKQQNLCQQIKGCVEQLQLNVKPYDDPDGIIDGMRPGDPAALPNQFKLTRLAEDYHSRSLTMTRERTKNASKQHRLRFKVKGAHRVVSNTLKDKQPAPLSYLRRVEDQGPHKPVGSIATDPLEVDGILHTV